MEEDLGRVQGWAGWSPVPAIADRGTDKVMVIADFVGGEDNKPTSEIGKYVGVDGLVSDIEDAVALPKGATGEKPKMNSTSITSNVIGTGAKTFTLATPLDMVVGQVAKAYSLSDPNNYVCGFIFSITPTEIVITVSEIGGVGTKTDWLIVSSAFQGKQGITTTNMSSGKVLGRNTAGVGTPEELTPVGLTLIDNKIVNGFSGLANGNTFKVINSPKSGVYSFNEAEKTGYLKIKLPIGGTDPMTLFSGTVYQYDGTGPNRSFQFNIGYYAYGSIGLGSSAVIISPNLSLKAIFVTHNNDFYVYIGESTSNWSYPQVSIDRVLAGFQPIPIDSLNNDFSIDITPTLTGTIARTISETRPQFNPNQILSEYNAESGVNTPLTNAMSPLQMFQNLQKQMDARMLNTGSSLNLILGNGTYKPVSDFILATQKGAANGVVPLNASTLIDQVYLPSYVDDIIEGYKSGSNFYKEVGLTTLITGETGKIYVDLTTGQNSKQYRWSGSAYIQITNGLIASTNDVAEGGSNLYFTVARVLATVISGFSAVAGVVANTDTILQAINKIVGNIALKADLASPTFTGTPSLPTGTIGVKQTVGDNTTKIATTSFVAEGLALKANIEATTGTLVALTFTSDSVQGTVASPLTGNITGNITGAKLGVVTLVIHNHTTAPTFDSKYKKLSGSGSYVTGSINYIFCEYINDTEIIYSINQRT